MAKTKFKWSNLPAEKVIDFKLLVYSNMKKEVLKMHDEYKLSSYNFACCNLSDLIMHCENAINKGLI